MKQGGPGDRRRRVGPVALALGATLLLMGGSALTYAHRQSCPGLSGPLPDSVAGYECQRYGVFPETQYRLRAAVSRAGFDSYVQRLRAAHPRLPWRPVKDTGKTLVLEMHSNGLIVSAIWRDGSLMSEWHAF